MTSRLNARKESDGNTVGDEEESWAVDGDRCLKWHAGDQGAFGVKWSVGDVIGLVCNREENQILVSVDGDFSAPTTLPSCLTRTSLLTPSTLPSLPPVGWWSRPWARTRGCLRIGRGRRCSRPWRVGGGP